MSDREYYAMRAAEERQKSKEAENLSAANSHTHLSLRYEYMAQIAARAEERKVQAVPNSAPQKAI